MTVTIAQIIFLVVAIALSAIILLQQTKGSGMGASFGGGASGTVFGARGSGSFLYKTTRLLAIIFFISALGLGYLQNKTLANKTILQETNLETQNSEVAVDVPVSSADNVESASPGDIPTPAPQSAE